MLHYAECSGIEKVELEKLHQIKTFFPVVYPPTVARLYTDTDMYPANKK